MARQITVTIENGAATVETKGYQGKACVNATAELEKAMGATTADRKTPEYEGRTQHQVGN